jgi:hypothetical protein
MCQVGGNTYWLRVDEVEVVVYLDDITLLCVKNIRCAFYFGITANVMSSLNFCLSLWYNNVSYFISWVSDHAVTLFPSALSQLHLGCIWLLRQRHIQQLVHRVLSAFSNSNPACWWWLSMYILSTCSLHSVSGGWKKVFSSGILQQNQPVYEGLVI